MYQLVHEYMQSRKSHYQGKHPGIEKSKDRTTPPCTQSKKVHRKSVSNHEPSSEQSPFIHPPEIKKAHLRGPLLMET